MLSVFDDDDADDDDDDDDDDEPKYPAHAESFGRQSKIDELLHEPLHARSSPDLNDEGVISPNFTKMMLPVRTRPLPRVDLLSRPVVKIGSAISIQEPTDPIPKRVVFSDATLEEPRPISAPKTCQVVTLIHENSLPEQAPTFEDLEALLHTPSPETVASDGAIPSPLAGDFPGRV